MNERIIRRVQQDEAINPVCCFIPCDKPAEFQLFDGPEPDNGTEACADHVGHLIQDGRVTTVYQIANEPGPEWRTAEEYAAETALPAVPHILIPNIAFAASFCGQLSEIEIRRDDFLSGNAGYEESAICPACRHALSRYGTVRMVK